MLTDDAFVRVREINKAENWPVDRGSSRTPPAACRSFDRGYVLDQGRNAYTGTGAALANDPEE